ncbi:MAG: hypothetical protein K1Y36_11525 [Blastocatellia bacterium]|jgi:hypothetical protein|nr:hypothetical protein [Blastocatellia bacterium]
MTLNRLLWGSFILCAGCALYFSGGDHPFISQGPLPAGKYLLWAVFTGFTAYTVYCSQRENLLKTLQHMATLHWGRQVGLDLYLGLTLSLFMIALNEKSVWVALLWLPPVYAFGNLATLLYFAIHYDSVVAKFLR